VPHVETGGPGKFLRDRRKAKGLRQEDLAALLGADRWRVGTWEREKNEPRADYREGLAEHLGGHPDDYRWSTEKREAASLREGLERLDAKLDEVLRRLSA